MWTRSPLAQAAWCWQRQWVYLGGCFQAGCCCCCSPKSLVSDLSGHLHLSLPGGCRWVQAKVFDQWTEAEAAVEEAVAGLPELQVAGTVECWQQEG